jgi:hypothetical protein
VPSSSWAGVLVWEATVFYTHAVTLCHIPEDLDLQEVY